MDLAVADDHLGVAIEDRRHQDRDVARVVLAIGIGVDDDICATLEGRIDPGREGHRQASVNREPNHPGARLAGHLGGLVAGAVIDDQDLDLDRSPQRHQGGAAMASARCSSSFQAGI